MSRILTCAGTSDKLVVRTVRVSGCVYTDLIVPKGDGVITGLPAQVNVSNYSYSSGSYANTNINTVLIANRRIKIVSVGESHRTVSGNVASFSIKKVVSGGGGIVTLLTGIDLQTPSGDAIVYDVTSSDNELNEGDAVILEYVSNASFGVKDGVVTVTSIIL